MKESLLEKFKLSLYIILDPYFLNRDSLITTCKEIISGGADIIQYRDKKAEDQVFLYNASLINDITKDKGIPLIINDRVDIALEIGAEGIHLGTSDIPLSKARELCGDDKIIGFSVHNMQEYKQSDPADYLGIGSIFPTSSKKNVEICGIEFLSRIRENTKKTLIGIGGINQSNFIEVIDAGADGIAMISSVYALNKVTASLIPFSEEFHKRKLSHG
jgi:thiamine-phosphate pyrophosphorylase